MRSRQIVINKKYLKPPPSIGMNMALKNDLLLQKEKW